MPGADRRLRVVGAIEFDTGGWSAEIIEHDGPQGINPRDLLMDIVAVEPQPPVTEVLTTVDLGTRLEYSNGDGDGQYDTVTFIPQFEGLDPQTVPVEILN